MTTFHFPEGGVCQDPILDIRVWRSGYWERHTSLPPGQPLTLPIARALYEDTARQHPIPQGNYVLVDDGRFGNSWVRPKR